MGRCERCGKQSQMLTGSWFNTQLICAGSEDSCIERERSRLDFKRAREAEEAACAQGNYNYPGIEADYRRWVNE